MNSTLQPNQTQSKWRAVTKERPCGNCGKTNGCKMSPDGTAFSCFKNGNGGKVFQTGGNGNGRMNGTGYVGKAHRPKPANSAKAKTAYVSMDEAIGKLLFAVKLQGSQDAKVSHRYAYPDDFWVIRFEWPGDKTMRPLYGSGDQWHLGDPAGLLPLYHRDELPADGPIYVTEGEKACDAAIAIGLPAVTSSHGAASAAKSDWSPAAGHEVIILRDNDVAGEKYAADVSAQILTINPQAKVKTVLLPDLPEGGDIVEFIDERDSAESSAIKSMIEDIAAGVEWSNPDDVEGALPSPVTAIDLMRDYPTLKPVVIEGVLRETETLNLIAASKVGKTHLAMALAISVATGRMWLEQYPVQRGGVLYIDCELHRETFARRLHSVCSAMGVMSDEIADTLSVLNLRGKLRDIFSLKMIFEQAKNKGYKLIILDALYRLLPDGTDENSNADATAIYNRLDYYADQTGAAIVVIHHSSKGGQGNKSVTDTGAGAGAIARAADSHFILRQHETDGAIVADAALRSFAPIQPQCFKWEYPLWKPAPDLDPTQLKTDRPRRQRKEETAPADEAKPWTIDRFVTEFVSAKAQAIDSIIINAEAHDLSERKAKQLLAAAIDAGKVFKWTFATKGKDRFSTIQQPLIEGAK